MRGKTVVVTGAASGFGAAIASRFAQSGHNVIVSDVNVEGARKLADGLDNATAVPCDVTQESSWKDLRTHALDAYGGVDVLVNNAGLPHLTKPFEEISLEDFDSQISINVRSVFFGCQQFLPDLRASRGSIINTASIAGRRPRPGLSIYNMTKGAIITLTRSLAAELAPDIRVNAVDPVASETGFMMNALGADLDDEQRAALVAGIPMGRPALPSDVANSVHFLASDDASFLTGVCLDVDGGRSIQ